MHPRTPPNPRPLSRTRVTRALVAALAAASLLTHAAHAQPQPAGPPPQTAPAPDSAVNSLFIMNVRAGADAPWQQGGLGVLVAPDRAIVHRQMLAGITQAKLVSPCCGERIILDVLADDSASTCALVRLAPIPPDAQPDASKPVALRQGCVPAGEIVKLSEALVEKTGFLFITAPSLGPMTWGSTPTSTLLEMPTISMLGAGAVYDQQERFVGFVGYFGGAHRSMVTPPNFDLNIDASHAVSLADFGARPKTAHERAVAAEAKGDAASVLNLFKQAVAEDPRDWYAQWRLGVAYDEAFQSEESLKALQASCELAPEFSEAWNSVGIVLIGLDRAADAVEQFRKASELEPRYAAAHGMLGIALFQSGKLDECVAPARKGFELDPKDIQLAKNLCAVLRATKQPALQLDVWKQFVKADPKNEEGREALSAASWNLPGDEPLQVQRDWMAFDPDNPKPVAWLATLLHQRGRDAEIAPIINEFLTRHPTDPVVGHIKDLLEGKDTAPADGAAPKK